MYYLFKNKKVNEIKDDEDIIKVNQVIEDDIITVNQVIDEDIIKDEDIIEDEDDTSKEITMPSLPLRIRKPIRKNQSSKSFSLSVFSYKIIDATFSNTVTLGVGVGLGIGLSIGVCLGTLLTFSLVSK